MLALDQLCPEQSLAQLVSPFTLRSLEQRVAKSGVPFAMWLRWEPLLVTLMLAHEQLACAGFKAEAGLEPKLGARAAAQQNPTRGLESAHEQLERFDTLPPATQGSLLRETRGGGGRAREDTLESAWRRGDLEALARAVLASPKASTRLRFPRRSNGQEIASSPQTSRSSSTRAAAGSLRSARGTSWAPKESRSFSPRAAIAWSGWRKSPPPAEASAAAERDDGEPRQ